MCCYSPISWAAKTYQHLACEYYCTSCTFKKKTKKQPKHTHRQTTLDSCILKLFKQSLLEVLFEFSIFFVFVSMPVLCWQRVELGELRGEWERPMGVVAILKCAGIDCAVCKRFPWLKREASVKTSFCHPAKHIWLKDFSNDIMGSITSFRFYSIQHIHFVNYCSH